MKIQTHLLSGAGNTFHILFIHQPLQDWYSQLSLVERKKIVRSVCERYSADGFIFLHVQNKEGAFNWDFYNKDGSEAEMCGNASRCVGFYIHQILQQQSSFWLLNTKAGLLQISVEHDLYKVGMTPIQILQSKHGFFCDTGVPHLILEITDFQNYHQYKEKAALLRAHTDFLPKGTNVTLVQLDTDKNKLKAVSFERGVEDFTEACGTGAVAAAMYNLMKRGSLKTQVEMPGGTLMMDLADLSQPKMIGPAILKGTFEYEV